MFEGKTVYLIPDDKRDEYLTFVDKFKNRISNVNDDNFNGYNVP